MLKVARIHFLVAADQKVDLKLTRRTLRMEETWWDAGVVVVGFVFHMR